MRFDHCPIPGCTEQRRPDQLMCLKHWRRVPRELQVDVYVTYQEYSNTPIRPVEAFAQANSARINAAALAIKAAGEGTP